MGNLCIDSEVISRIILDSQIFFEFMNILKENKNKINMTTIDNIVWVINCVSQGETNKKFDKVKNFINIIFFIQFI